MGSTSLDSRVLSSAVLRVSGESMEEGVITADVATHEEVTPYRRRISTVMSHHDTLGQVVILKDPRGCRR